MQLLRLSGMNIFSFDFTTNLLWTCFGPGIPRANTCSFSIKAHYTIFKMVMLLLSQTWVHSQYTWTNLLIMGCDEEKNSIDCRGASKDNRQLMLQRPNLPDGFQGKGFQDGVREGAAVCELSLFLALDLVGSRWSFKHHQPSGFNQSRVSVLVVSSFHLVGVCFT